MNDVKHVCNVAKSVGALSFIDAVHYAPHGLLDVRHLECDFMACSPYKFSDLIQDCSLDVRS